MVGLRNSRSGGQLSAMASATPSPAKLSRSKSSTSLASPRPLTRSRSSSNLMVSSSLSSNNLLALNKAATEHLAAEDSHGAAITLVVCGVTSGSVRGELEKRLLDAANISNPNRRAAVTRRLQRVLDCDAVSGTGAEQKVHLLVTAGSDSTVAARKLTAPERAACAGFHGTDLVFRQGAVVAHDVVNDLLAAPTRLSAHCERAADGGDGCGRGWTATLVEQSRLKWRVVARSERPIVSGGAFREFLESAVPPNASAAGPAVFVVPPVAAWTAEAAAARGCDVMFGAGGGGAGEAPRREEVVSAFEARECEAGRARTAAAIAELLRCDEGGPPPDLWHNGVPRARKALEHGLARVAFVAAGRATLLRRLATPSSEGGLSDQLSGCEVVVVSPAAVGDSADQLERDFGGAIVQLHYPFDLNLL